jgi:hypothetical protein
MPITEQDRIDFGYYKLEREDAEVKEALTTYTITEDERKQLTKFIGECFHKPGLAGYCTKCRGFIERGDGNREFTTPDDRQTLCEALMKEGKWNRFHVAMRHEFCKDYITVCTREQMEAEFNAWLLVEKPERFAKLCAEFLEVEEK